MTPDIINGAFEVIGGLLILLSVMKLYHDKEVKGIHWGPTTFFATWGYWNLFFYPALDQWFSFIGGIVMVAMNSVWLALMLYYSYFDRDPRPWSEKCKRFRTDGPTPCLCCKGKCYG